MAKPADPRKKTLLDPDMMGGIVGGKGYDFQTRYAACRLVRWLGEGLEQLLMEGVGDIDVRFANGERHLFQVKDHEVRAGEFREVLEQFLEIDGSNLGVYQRYVLVCTGLVSTLRPLENRDSSVVHGVTVTADGKRAVSASWDKTLKVWDLECGRFVRTLEGHAEAVLGVGVNGQRAVSASRDKTLKIWDLETGRNIATFSCDARATCCAWIDAHRIIAGDEGGRVYFLCLEE